MGKPQPPAPHNLPERIRERIADARYSEGGTKAAFAKLDTPDLIVAARFWMRHCEAPQKFKPNWNVWDSTFWHVIVPELLRRLEEKKK